MTNSETILTLCGGLIGLLFFIAFFLMFGWAILKDDFFFHYGRIHGRLARVIGVIELLGITAGAYLAISFLIFDTEPPFAYVAALLFGIFFFTLLVVRFLAILLWHSN